MSALNQRALHCTALHCTAAHRLVSEPPVRAQLQLEEHLPVALHLVLLPEHLAGPHQGSGRVPGDVGLEAEDNGDDQSTC